MILIGTLWLCIIVILAFGYNDEIVGGIGAAIIIGLFGYGFLCNVIPVKTNLYLIEDYTVTKTPIRTIVETDNMYEIFNSTDLYLNTDDFEFYLKVKYNSYGNPTYKGIVYQKKKE